MRVRFPLPALWRAGRSAISCLVGGPVQLPMKPLRVPAWSGSVLGAMGRNALLFCGVLLLAAGFWTALLPAVLAREATAADLIADQLPGRKTLKTATKSQFLGAVC